MSMVCRRVYSGRDGKLTLFKSARTGQIFELSIESLSGREFVSITKHKVSRSSKLNARIKLFITYYEQSRQAGLRDKELITLTDIAAALAAIRAVDPELLIAHK